MSRNLCRGFLVRQRRISSVAVLCRPFCKASQLRQRRKDRRSSICWKRPRVKKTLRTIAACQLHPFLLRLLSKPATQFGQARPVSQDDLPSGKDRFPLTRRSVIEAVRSIDAEERALALEALCAAYWKPVYKYVRWRWNRPGEAAQDLTQGFFAELLERELLDKFDSSKSWLRTYLRVCVDSFVMNEDKAGRRQKRGGNVLHVALDFASAEEEFGATTMDPALIPSPESLEQFFEKEWVRSLFALAVEDLRELCVARERERTFHLFEAYDLEGNEKLSYEQLSREYGISVTDVTNALAWARREFRRIALDRLRELCSSEEEFQREARAAFGWDAK